MIYRVGRTFAEKAGDFAELAIYALKNWKEYKDTAVMYAKPRIKKAESYASNTARKISKVYVKNKKKAKRNLFMVKLRNITDVVKNITIIGVALLAFFSLILRLLDNLEN